MAKKRYRPKRSLANCVRLTSDQPGQEGGRVIKTLGVTDVTDYRWRRSTEGCPYPGQSASRAGEGERTAPESVLDLTLDKMILKEAARGNF